MGEKSKVLSQAQALSEMGMTESARPLWMAAASYEERIAPLLDASGRDRDASIHRISAASCYQTAGDFSRAANLFRASLAGPLREETRKEVEQMLADCLAQLVDTSDTPAA
jgi:hypothetical protein